MTEKRYFVTHSAGHIHCDSITSELDDGSFEDLSYKDIVDRLNESEQLKQQVNNCLDSVPFWETVLDDKKKLQKENEQLEQRLKEVLDELYCKDRILERNGIDIECCDDSK